MTREIETEFTEAVDRTVRSRFRSITDIGDVGDLSTGSPRSTTITPV